MSSDITFLYHRSEANDTAISIAEAATEHSQVIALDGLVNTCTICVYLSVSFSVLIIFSIDLIMGIQVLPWVSVLIKKGRLCLVVLNIIHVELLLAFYFSIHNMLIYIYIYIYISSHPSIHPLSSFVYPSISLIIHPFICLLLVCLFSFL